MKRSVHKTPSRTGKFGHANRAGRFRGRRAGGLRDRLLLIGVLILAGLFLVRRFVMLAHPPRMTSTGASNSLTGPASEKISPDEQRALDQLIHDKTQP